MFLGLLTSEATATKASNILKEMINRHIDLDILTDENNVESKESRIVKSLCDALLKILNTHKGTPNEHTLAVISVLFLKLGMSKFQLLFVWIIVTVISVIST